MFNTAHNRKTLAQRVFALALVAMIAFTLVGFTACGGDDGIVGTWRWEGTDYYTFNSNGTGNMMGMPLNWGTSGNVLSICITPTMCGTSIDACMLPAEWTFSISGRNMTLIARNEITGFASGTSFSYTRR